MLKKHIPRQAIWRIAKWDTTVCDNKLVRCRKSPSNVSVARQTKTLQQDWRAHEDHDFSKHANCIYTHLCISGGFLMAFEFIISIYETSHIVALHCIWEGSTVLKILLQGVGVICPPGKHHSENWLFGPQIEKCEHFVGMFCFGTHMVERHSCYHVQ